jgi:hypothetical protein
MVQILIRGSNPEACGVVVGSKVRREAFTLRCFQQLRQYKYRLRRFDHDFDAHIGIGLKGTN